MFDRALHTETFASETDENVRYVLNVEHDTDAGCPISDWDSYVDLHVLKSGYDSTLLYDPQRGDNSTFKTMKVFLEVWDRHNADKALKVAQRFQNILGEPELLIDVKTTHGDVQSEWHTMVCAVESGGYGEPSGYIEELAQWCYGHIYGVTVSREERCSAGDWHEIDIEESLWGIYAESAEEAAEYFKHDWLPHDARQSDAVAN